MTKEKKLVKSSTKINRKKIVHIRCKECKTIYSQGARRCPLCKSTLQWLCICGVYRSYSNLSTHNCERTNKRQKLKEKFRNERRKLKKRITKIYDLKLKKNVNLLHPRIENSIPNILNVKNEKLNNLNETWFFEIK